MTSGVMLVATLAKRLGVEALAGRLVRLRRDRPAAANTGRKVMAVLFAMVLGADSIDDCEVLRAGRTRRLLGGWILVPSKLLGYHPILATRSDTREVLHIRLRKGLANTQKGMLRFTDELIARVARAGASGVKLLRVDSGFWNVKVCKRLEKAGWEYSIGVRMIPAVRKAVEAIEESAWQRIEYPEEGEAQIAETTYGGRRLIVRGTRLVGAQAQLWPDWRHFAFLTNRTEDIAIVEAEHRDHAVTAPSPTISRPLARQARPALRDNTANPPRNRPTERLDHAPALITDPTNSSRSRRAVSRPPTQPIGGSGPRGCVCLSPVPSLRTRQTPPPFPRACKGDRSSAIMAAL